MQSLSRCNLQRALPAAPRHVLVHRKLGAASVRRCKQQPADQRHSVTAQASSAPTHDAAAEPQPFKWGADMKKLGMSVALGLVLWFVPAPNGVTTKAWHLLAIFCSTILGIITQPVPLGAVAMLGLGVSMLTQTLTFEQAFSAFSSQIPCVPLRRFGIVQSISKPLFLANDVAA